MRFALGAAQFGMNYGVANNLGKPTQGEVKDIIACAKFHGIDTIDTAISYGDSEKSLGEIGVDNWKIISKLPEALRDSVDVSKEIWSMVDGSVRRLKVERLYGLLLHRPQELLEKNGDNIYRAMQEIKKEGLVQKIGISIYDPELLEDIMAHFDFDLVQAPFNPLDQRLISLGYASSLKSKGIELHVRSIFLQGLLLMQHEQRPAKFQRWSLLWGIWHKWLNDEELTPIQACLGFVKSFPDIDRVIVGVESKDQLIEILEASQLPAIRVPSNLQVDDLDLINPSNWA